ncbi:MAG: hypothetical protein PVJ67_05235 [Candidatus Pacearchaeota archaeon]|jgi:hypothetical protein
MSVYENIKITKNAFNTSYQINRRAEDIVASVAVREGININKDELIEVVSTYATKSILSMDSCLQLFSLHLFQGNSYEKTLKRFREK